MKYRVPYILAALLFSILLYLFYFKYVPLIPSYQRILLPIILANFLASIIHINSGLIFLAFLFPLINSLPYFFRLYENVPQAPPTLILFLFFFLGWLWRKAVFPLSIKKPTRGLSKYLLLFSLLILTSTLITIFRYSNFFPLNHLGLFEWKTNVNGVSAGGAIMSSLFSSLNYLTGIVFFVFLSVQLKEKNLKEKLLMALTLSTCLSIFVGFFQVFFNKSFGNTPFWVNLGQINLTFKDPNSAAAFLGTIMPIFLAAALASNKIITTLSFSCLFILSLIIFSSTGSRGAFLGLILCLSIFMIKIFLSASADKALKKKILAVVLLITIAIIIIFIIYPSNQLVSRLRWSIHFLSKEITADEFFNRRLYFWRAAIAMIADYPLSGVGLGAYIIELPNYLKDLNLPFRETDSALNHLIQIGAELGLIGLGAFLLIVISIIRYFIILWKSISFKKAEDIKTFGFMCGLISLGVNFIFQTFIGSYEIKYLTWLLIALIITHQKDENSNFKSKGKGTVKFKLLSLNNWTALTAFIIGIYAFSLLSASIHSLSLSYRTQKYNLYQEFGLDRPEKTSGGQEFRWTGKSAALPLSILGPKLILPLHASHPDIRQNPVIVELFLVNPDLTFHRSLGKISLENSDWHLFEFNLDQELGTKKILLIKTSRTWNPYKVAKIKDLRNLGVALGKPMFADKK